MSIFWNQEKLRKCVLTLVVSICIIQIGYSDSQEKSITIVSTESSKGILLYYNNILTAQTSITLRAGEKITINIDTTLARPLLVYFPCSMKRISLPCIALLPGDTVYVSYDEKMDSYRYKGKHTGELIFFKALGSSDLNLAPTTFWAVNHYKNLSYNTYMELCQPIFRRIDSVIRYAMNDKSIRPEIQKYIEQEFKLMKFTFLTAPAYKKDLIDYAGLVPQFYQDSISVYSKLLQVNGSNLIYKSERIVYLLSHYAAFLTILKKINSDRTSVFLTAVNSFSGPLRELACYYIIKDAQHLGEDVSKLIPIFQTLVPPENLFLIQLLKNESLNNYSLLEDSSLNDILIDRNGNKVNLFDIISKNKGNVIYLDFWASWCGPCILELPNSRSLANRYNEKNFKVIFVSIDSKVQKWKEAMDKFLPGDYETYLLSDPVGSGLIKKFSINSIPRYFLIDKNGVLKNQKAPQPSDPSLTNLLTPLLSEEN